MASGWEMLSGKFAVLATMLDKLRRETTDRIVIVSNYTQTLDLIAHLCKSRMVSIFYDMLTTCNPNGARCKQSFCFVLLLSTSGDAIVSNHGVCLQYPCLRLDGSTPLAKRQKLVKQFNDLEQSQFVFLLSSKAGGCGLNLVGGNRYAFAMSS